MGGGSHSVSRRTALESVCFGVASAIAWSALASDSSRLVPRNVERASSVPPSTHSPPQSLDAPTDPATPTPGGDPDPETKRASRRAFDSAVAALRALRNGILCGACDGRGVVSRRTQVGWRDIGGGMRVPLYAPKEGECTSCDGEGCAARRRCERLVAVALERLGQVPEAHGLRTEAILAARRTLDGLLLAAAPALARRSEEIAADAVVRAREGPTPMLLVGSPPPRGDGASGGTRKGGADGGTGGGNRGGRGGGTGSGAGGSAGTPSAGADSSAGGGASPSPILGERSEVVVQGVLWRLADGFSSATSGRRLSIPIGIAEGWVAALGWVDSSPHGETVRRGGASMPVVDFRVIAVAARAAPARPPREPGEKPAGRDATRRRR